MVKWLAKIEIRNSKCVACCHLSLQIKDRCVEPALRGTESDNPAFSAPSPRENCPMFRHNVLAGHYDTRYCLPTRSSDPAQTCAHFAGRTQHAPAAQRSGPVPGR